MDTQDFISTSNVDTATIWENILEEISKKISAFAYDVYVKTLNFADIKGNTLVLETPTKSSRDSILKNLKDVIIESAQTIYKPITALQIDIVDPSKKASEQEEVETPKTTERVYVDKSTQSYSTQNFRFDPKYTFDSFIIGSSNQFAAAAAKAVAEEPGTKINPLFIYGDSGLGKTHLLHAIGNYINENTPNLNAVYVTTAKFTDDFIMSLQTHTTAQFREVYRKADVLIIDDIQSIIKKPQVQEQFFNIFNELYQNGKQIVLTSDKQPKELNPLEERLRSRFEWGMLADIGAPDVETKIAILNKKAQIERYNVSREVIEYIADVSTSNIRTLEGYLSRAVFYSKILKEDIVTLPTAREALKNIADENEGAIDGTKIIDTVCKFYGIKKEEIVARNRKKNIAEARQVAMYLCTELLSIPLETIGNMFGKDHATVIYAKNKVQDDMKKSKKLEVQINDLKHMIEGK